MENATTENCPIVIRIPTNAVTNYDLKGHVRMQPPAEIELRRLQLETGLSLCDIASQLITQAAVRATIVRGSE